MKEEIKRLERWAQGEKQPPVGIELAPTLRCNLNCKFCWRRKKDFNKNDKYMKQREMSLQRYIEIIEEAADLGVEEVRIIGGGEPMVNSDTLKIMEAIKEENLYGYICTNGSLFDDEAIERTIEMGWDYVKFSIHGTKETHNKLVGGQVYKRVIDKLRKLGRSDVETEIGMVVVNQNYQEIEDMLTLSEDLNVDNFFLEPVTVYSDLGEELKLTEAEENDLKQRLKSLKDSTRTSKVNTNLEAFIDESLVNSTNQMKEFILSKIDKENHSFTEIPCYEPFLRMGIRVDGRVAPCGFYDEERGDSVRERSLREVWYGSYFEERRKEQIEKKLPDYCSKCCTTLVNKQRKLGEKLKEVL